MDIAQDKQNYMNIFKTIQVRGVRICRSTALHMHTTSPSLKNFENDIEILIFAKIITLPIKYT